MKKLRSLFEIAAVLVVGLFCTSELQAQRVDIPTGTLVDLRMDTGLNSGRARVNDAFRATVTRAVWIDGRIAVPRDSKSTVAFPWFNLKRTDPGRASLRSHLRRSRLTADVMPSTARSQA